MKKLFILIPLFLLAILVLTGCKTSPKHPGITTEDLRTHADSIALDATDTRNLHHALAVIDSLENKGELSKIRTIFFRTIAYNVHGEYRASMDLYYQLADIDVNSLDDQADYECYFYSYKDYLRLLCEMKRYDEALREAYAVNKKMKSVGDESFTLHHDIAEIIGECQLYLGQTDEAARNFQKSLKGVHDKLNVSQKPLDFRECQHTMKSVAMAYINAGAYRQALPWIERQDSLYTIASNRSNRDTVYIDEMKADISYCKALYEHARGGLRAAEIAYRDYLSTYTSKNLENIINSTEYLMLTRRYNEAADNYMMLQRFMQESGYEVDLENIGRYLLPKYRANVLAGRKDSALSVASQIAEAYDSALIRQKASDARLMAAVHDTEGKERLIAEQKTQLSQQQLVGTAVVLVLLVFIFVEYTLRRRKAYMKLNEVNRQLSEEVRGSLNVISGFSQVLSNPNPDLDWDDLRAISKQIQENCDRIGHTIDKTLDPKASEKSKEMTVKH